MEEDKTPRLEHHEGGRRSTDNDVVHEKTIRAHDVVLETAVQSDKPSLWGPGYRKLYAICFLVYFCSTMTGYDSSLMGSINAMNSYIEYYDLPPRGNSSTGIVFAIFQVGQMAASPFIWIADWQGRRWPIFWGCVGVLVGSVVTATSPTLGGFVAGRFFIAFFATIASTTAAMYLIEISPPQYRGTLGGMYNTLYYFGSILATVTVYASNRHLADQGIISWRLSLWLQIICPAFVCLGVWFCPESPRWLIGNDRIEEARQIVALLHADGNEAHPLVELQVAEMHRSLQEEGMMSWKKYLDQRSLFSTRSKRYRNMLNIAFSWFGQFSGNNVASYYLPYLVANVGITDTSTQLLLNIIYALGGWIPAMIGARLHDVFGRRKMLLSTTMGMAVCLAIAAGTAAGYVQTGSKACSSASIAFIYVFGSIFALGYTAMQPIYPAEVLSNEMRAKGSGLSTLVSGAAGFVNTFAAPVALNNIRYWFYVFFVLWDLFEFAFIYFFFVETKGRTLEELDAIFEARNPRKASTAKTTLVKRVIRHGDLKEEVTVAAV